MGDCDGYEKYYAYEDLQRFAGDSEQEISAAFWRLWPCIESRLDRFLQSREGLSGGGHEQDRQDIIAQARDKVLQGRLQGKPFQNEGVPAWRGYVTRVCDHCHLDWLRERRRIKEPPPEEEAQPGETEDDSRNEDTSWLEDKQIKQRILHTTNYLWLGLDRDKPLSLHRRQQLAALLYYRDGWDQEEILRTLQRIGAGALALDDLDSWFQNPGVLRCLAYTLLYYSIDRLTASLLGVEESKLNALANEANTMPPMQEAFGGFTWLEALIILWRYRHRETPDQILNQVSEKVGEDYPREKLEELLAILEARYPFKNQMVALRACLRRRQVTDSGEIFDGQENGLWKRLVFEYRYVDGLTHKQIQQCTNPAAQQVSFEVSEGILISWLSNIREFGEDKEKIRGALLYQLLKELVRVYGKDWRAER